MIEVHFNWIFILIAGAVIFVFFINIVNKQREFSDIRTSGTNIDRSPDIDRYCKHNRPPKSEYRF
jgi:hypothetical protein